MNTPTTAPTAPGALPGKAAAPPRLVRLAVDSDDLNSLFPADFVRTYADLIPDPAALDHLRGRFPDSTVELIDRGLGDPTGAANIFDVETGALTAEQAATRIRADQQAGRRWQTVYCSLANLAAVDEAFRNVDAYKWIGAWGTIYIQDHPDAQIQFADSGMLGFHADLSLVWDPTYRPAAHAAAISAAAVTPPMMAAVAAAAQDPVSRLRGVLQAVQAHHGQLAVLEHDLALVPQMLASHAGLLTELSHLVLP